MERLSSLDLAMLCLDRPEAQLQCGALALFEPASGDAEPDGIVQLITERACQIPRLRQRVRSLWWPPGAARWEEDPRFDPACHVRHARLRSSDPEALTEFAAEVMARPLDRSRPLWELHVVSGLQNGRFAIVVKLHHALADGLRAVALGSSLLDEASPSRGRDLLLRGFHAGSGDGQRGPYGESDPGNSRSLGLPWREAFEAVGGAAATIGSQLSHPGRLIAPLAHAPRHVATGISIGGAVLGAVFDSAPTSPLNVDLGRTRRVGVARVPIDDVHRVRKVHGGTVNDVLLAAVSGALRRWLAARGHEVDSLRALIPTSRISPNITGNRFSAFLIRLPVTDDGASTRLSQIRQVMDDNKAAGPARGPGALGVLADAVPPILHHLATPWLGLATPQLFNLMITNIPVPDLPLTMSGAELRELYPLAPLAHRQALSVAFATYQDHVHVGFFADRNALPDLDVLAGAVPGALTELMRGSKTTVRAPSHSATSLRSRATAASPPEGTRPLS